jgi:hypothetical protein
VHAGAVFLDEFADAVAALAGALGAFEVQHVERALDVAEDEVRASRSPCERLTTSGTLLQVGDFIFFCRAVLVLVFFFPGGSSQNVDNFP